MHWAAMTTPSKQIQYKVVITQADHSASEAVAQTDTQVKFNKVTENQFYSVLANPWYYSKQIIAIYYLQKLIF